MQALVPGPYLDPDFHTRTLGIVQRIRLAVNGKGPRAFLQAAIKRLACKTLRYPHPSVFGGKHLTSVAVHQQANSDHQAF
nr:hypothetical protein L321_18307 [Pseudomonas plecoglossicida NB2011]